jgi:hypothetical protein
MSSSPKERGKPVSTEPRSPSEHYLDAARLLAVAESPGADSTVQAVAALTGIGACAARRGASTGAARTDAAWRSRLHVEAGGPLAVRRRRSGPAVKGATINPTIREDHPMTERPAIVVSYAVRRRRAERWHRARLAAAVLVSHGAVAALAAYIAS